MLAPLSQEHGKLVIAEQVLIVLKRLHDAGVRAYITGGWGVDALIGTQTRPHADLDIAIDSEREANAINALEAMGFRGSPEVDWHLVRFVMRDTEGREIDLHPVRFDEGGNGVQANVDGLPSFHYPAGQLTTGHIDGQTVPCISSSLQFVFHQGYEPRPRDEHDLCVLHRLPRAGSRGQ